MATDPTQQCAICKSPFRYKVEDLYLQGDLAYVRQSYHFTRHEVEAHMGHVADPEVLRTIAGLTNATAVAARLRQIEQAQGAILEAALTGVEIEQEDGSLLKVPPDLKLALAATRELRASLVELAKMDDKVDSQQGSSVERVDLDSMLADYLARRGHEQARTAAAEAASEERERTFDRGAQRELEGHTPLALPPGV
jgi:hypothetical protein